jgi:hypothetical protein
MTVFKRKNKLGGRPQIMHDRTQMMISFERDRLKEFEEYCIENKMSVSQGLRELLEEFLEKKELGQLNPLNIPYTNDKQKPFQLTLEACMDELQRVKDNPERVNIIEGISIRLREECRQLFYYHRRKRLNP